MKKGILITGTDTNVGKTYIACGLIETAISERIKLAVMKPVETGCKRFKNKLIPLDAIKLMKTAKMQNINEVNLYRFYSPVAPYVAQKLENKRININRIKDVYNTFLMRNDLVIVEGAGGLLVPIKKNFSYADLAKELSLSILLIAPNKLGVINHVMLTIEYIRKHKLDLLGIIINNIGNKDHIAKKTNTRTISSLINNKFFVKEIEFNHPETNISIYKYILKCIERNIK